MKRDADKPTLKSSLTPRTSTHARVTAPSASLHTPLFATDCDDDSIEPEGSGFVNLQELGSFWDFFLEFRREFRLDRRLVEIFCLPTE